MSKMTRKLTNKILKLLKEGEGKTIKEMAKRFKVNRVFLSGYLAALEDRGYVESRKIGPAKIYFVKNKKK